MESQIDIYMGTVCLERNRWGSREPSFLVSDWLPRFEADGFGGVELWEKHYLAAGEAEQARLVSAASSVAIYNSYAAFDDDGAALREQAVDAVTRLGTPAVKYNLGSDPTQLASYRRNLLTWSEQMPQACHLLCECHAGTVLERVDDAVTFFADLDPARFGIIMHPVGDPALVQGWFEAFGSRLAHLHIQMCGPETDPTVPGNRDALDLCFGVVRAHGFKGTATMEFTRGIGKDEDIETLYANACIDLAYCKGQLE